MVKNLHVAQDKCGKLSYMHECSLDYLKIVSVLAIQIYHEYVHRSYLIVPLKYFVGGKIVLLLHHAC